ncbi:MAG: methyltransferase domain-containing protein [Verrucomicrobiota bacterium]
MNSESCPFGPSLERYWGRLSSEERRFSLDEEALYSLAIQEVALEISDAILGESVVDAFCGAGGLSIAMARRGKRVIAIDCSAERIRMARENAMVFEVEGEIEFICGDALQLVPALEADAILLDPPWGGTGYGRQERFLLSDFQPDGAELLEAAFASFREVVMRLPKNFCFPEIERLGRSFRIQENRNRDELLHYCVYFFQQANGE